VIYYAGTRRVRAAPVALVVPFLCGLPTLAGDPDRPYRRPTPSVGEPRSASGTPHRRHDRAAAPI